MKTRIPPSKLVNILTISFLVLMPLGAAHSLEAGWLQWGRTAQHDSNSPLRGQPMAQVDADIVIDPFVAAEQAASGEDLLAHYPVPLVDGNNVFLLRKGGSFVSLGDWGSESWSVKDFRWINGQLTEAWVFNTDWVPVPEGSPTWEPVYHFAATADSIWAPAAGGSVDRIDRVTGTLTARINPFGGSINPDIYVAGPVTIDGNGNIFYNAILLDASDPWGSDVRNSWLVRIGADGSVKKATFASLTPDAPAGLAMCTVGFSNSQLPFPPSPNAVAPTDTCGSQRPGINVAPAVAADGTIYTISRAQFNDREAFLIAVNPDLSPKWSASLKHRFNDGCNVTIPPNGSPGGCRSGAMTGVDPAVNQMGSGRVLDDSTSSPVVTPDGKILYGSETRYNYSEGHLMMFDSDGTFLHSYGWGWDLTPGIYRHNNTYSIVLKENHYEVGSYCNTVACPFDRDSNTPADPEAYYVTQLDPQLQVEWRYQNTNTESCLRQQDGGVNCQSDHPFSFEWCVNAVAIDSAGVVYANSEDGNIYAIEQGGTLRQNFFLRLALGAAYTPISIGDDGRIYTQNAGEMFVLGGTPRRRAIEK
jgi:hypothetical protein